MATQLLWMTLAKSTKVLFCWESFIQTMSYAGKAALDERCFFFPGSHGFADKKINHKFQTSIWTTAAVKNCKHNVKELTGSWNTSETLQNNFQIKNWFISFDTIVLGFGTDIWRPGALRIMTGELCSWPFDYSCNFMVTAAKKQKLLLPEEKRDRLSSWGMYYSIHVSSVSPCHIDPLK